MKTEQEAQSKSHIKHLFLTLSHGDANDIHEGHNFLLTPRKLLPEHILAVVVGFHHIMELDRINLKTEQRNEIYGEEIRLRFAVGCIKKKWIV